METLTTQGNALRLVDLEKEFRAPDGGMVTAVNNISLDVAPGEFVSLLGPSGCGKTTILRMVAGLEQPSGGEILIGEERVNELPPYKRNIGLVFQSYALFPHKTVFDNVAYSQTLRRRPKAEIKSSVDEMLALVGLDHHADRFPTQLSGGQQQRVALARALVSDPRVLLFDEPLSNLDARLRVQVRAEIRRVHQRLRPTVIYVTHDQSEAMSMSDRIAVMSAGQVIQLGTPQDIYQRPDNKFVADFVGSANFFPARVLERKSKELVVEFSGGTFKIGSWAPGCEQNDDVLLVIRQEHLEILPESDSSIHGIIRGTEFLGTHTECMVEIGGQTALATLESGGSRTMPALGSKVGIRFRENRVHVIANTPE
ncbi:ABC transporter ATP-binding protein [Labrenzia sp. DG1229]|uniref:ABC transporter ATP-binding protein n=1 Tax=Labrenzia sp. DG1229 TaxID=681847 RepID=UPI00048EC970|nr:ABC transporter ATP-binding protein [Labrenzia sp. DG1229]